MTNKVKFNVDDAYAVESTDDIVRLYDAWAETYDSDLIDSLSYVVYLRVAEALVRQRALINGAVLDVGCGTGLVGERLCEGGIAVIDGVDIAPRMLAEASKKKTRNGKPVYRKLIEADLTKGLDSPDNEYGGLISAGTFTHKHLGPDSLDELWRVAAPGAQCAIGVRSTHFDSQNFAGKLSADVASGRITNPDIVEINMYSEHTSDMDHADDKALIVACQIV